MKNQYDAHKSTNDNLKNLYEEVSDLSDGIAASKATRILQILCRGTASEGSLSVPSDILKYTLIIAIVGGECVLCVQYGGTVSGRGYSQGLKGTVVGQALEYEATDTLEALILFK